MDLGDVVYFSSATAVGQKRTIGGHLVKESSDILTLLVDAKALSTETVSFSFVTAAGLTLGKLILVQRSNLVTETQSVHVPPLAPIDIDPTFQKAQECMRTGSIGSSEEESSAALALKMARDVQKQVAGQKQCLEAILQEVQSNRKPQKTPAATPEPLTRNLFGKGMWDERFATQRRSEERR